MSRKERDRKLAAWLLGERLGSGVAREVFVYRPDPKYVLKIEHGEYDFQNIAEWSLWSAAPKSVRKWLAPCQCISADGMVLLQEYAKPCPAEMIPKRVPGVLNDLHDDNWGLIEGRPVVRDYGRHLAHRLTANAGRALVPIGLRTRG